MLGVNFARVDHGVQRTRRWGEPFWKRNSSGPGCHPGFLLSFFFLGYERHVVLSWHAHPRTLCSPFEVSVAFGDPNLKLNVSGGAQLAFFHIPFGMLGARRISSCSSPARTYDALAPFSNFGFQAGGWRAGAASESRPMASAISRQRARRGGRSSPVAVVRHTPTIPTTPATPTTLLTHTLAHVFLGGAGTNIRFNPVRPSDHPDHPL